MKKKENGKYIETHTHGRVWMGKRRDSGIWYLRCPVPNSPKPVFKSTGLQTKRDAIKAAEFLNQQVLNKKYGVADGTITIELLFEKFLSSKQDKVKPKTHRRLVSTINVFNKWLTTTHLEVRLAKHITSAILEEFQKARKSEDIQPRSIDNDIMNLHTIFKWAIRQTLMASSPADYSREGTIELYDEPEDDPDVYTKEEFLSLIKVATDARDWLIADMIRIFGDTGMRYQELANLMPKCICWDTEIPTIKIFAHDGWTPKDEKEKKTIPMTVDVQAIIRRRCSQCKSTSEYLFTNSAGGMLHESHPRDKLKKYQKLIGIGDDRRLHWHSFRNYFIITCLSNGVSMDAIMMMTGHDSAKMVLHYARAGIEERLFSEFKKLNGDWSDIGKSVLRVEKDAVLLAKSS